MTLVGTFTSLGSSDSGLDALVDYFGDGNFARTATYDSGVRVPMWVIRSW